MLESDEAHRQEREREGRALMRRRDVRIEQLGKEKAVKKEKVL